MVNLLHKNKKIKFLLNRILNVTLVISMFVMSLSGVNANNTVSGVVDEINRGDGPYEIIRQIISVLSFLGFGIAIIKLAQIGFLFLFSGVKKKSDAKSALLPWAIGAAVCMLFGTIGPWAIELIMGDNTGGVFDI